MVPRFNDVRLLKVSRGPISPPEWVEDEEGEFIDVN